MHVCETPGPRSMSHLMECPMVHIPTKTDLKEAIPSPTVTVICLTWTSTYILQALSWQVFSWLSSDLHVTGRIRFILSHAKVSGFPKCNSLFSNDTRKTRLSKCLHHSSLLTQTWLVLQDCKTLFSSGVRNI